MPGHHEKQPNCWHAQEPTLYSSGREPQYCDVKSVAGYFAARCISLNYGRSFFQVKANPPNLDPLSKPETSPTLSFDI